MLLQMGDWLRSRKRIGERRGYWACRLASRNVAVARIRVNGEERIMTRLNDPNLLHSEERLARDVDRLRRKGFKVEVEEIFTERIPCTEQGCREQIRATLDDANTYFYTRQNGQRAAKDLAEGYRW